MARFGPHVLDVLRARLATQPPAVPRPADDSSSKAAAVLVPLFVAGGEVHVVLTKKTEHLRSHSGQVAFPGGGWDPQDGTLERTALREAHEEAGIRPSDVEIIGTLDDLPTATTGYLIRPFVAVIPHPYTFAPDGFEVERVLTPPLWWFTDPSRTREETWERGGVSYPMHFFDVDGEVVWGATARMLVGLVAIIEGREPPPVVGIPAPDLEA